MLLFWICAESVRRFLKGRLSEFVLAELSFRVPLSLPSDRGDSGGESEESGFRAYIDITQSLWGI